MSGRWGVFTHCVSRSCNTGGVSSLTVFHAPVTRAGGVSSLTVFHAPVTRTLTVLLIEKNVHSDPPHDGDRQWKHGDVFHVGRWGVRNAHCVSMLL